MAGLLPLSTYCQVQPYVGVVLGLGLVVESESPGETGKL